MSELDKLASSLQKYLTESDDRKTKPYDTKAEVLRVEGDTAWVKIPGGVDETPVQRTNNATPGDTVMVRLSGGRAWIAGNNTSPATDDTRANIAYDVGMGASVAADTAIKEAGRAMEAADNAEYEAGRAKTAADHAEEVALGVEGIAKSAKTAADTAFTNLSQVQSVLDVVNWVAQHGTYEKATIFNPNATYYTMTGTVVSEPSDIDKDSQGVLIYYELVNDIYVRTTDTEVDDTKTYYLVTGTPVAQPDAEHISDYYTLAVTDAMADYIQSHLALTNDGLYVMSDDSDWKVLIDNNGVYIVDKENNRVSKYMASITIGRDDGSQSYLFADYHSLQLIDKEINKYLHISDLRDKNGECEINIYHVTPSVEDATDPSLIFIDTILYSPLNNQFYVTALLADSDWDPTAPPDPETEEPIDISDWFSYTYSSAGRLRISPTLEYDFREGKMIWILISYITKDEALKVYTLGTRVSSPLDAYYNIKPGGYSLIAGKNLVADGYCSQAFGENSIAKGNYSHAEGNKTTASGYISHAEGHDTTASGLYSHAEGYRTTASEDSSHAEGYRTTASESHAHAEGADTIASGNASHAEGSGTVAAGVGSHAQNIATIAQRRAQTAIGEFNIVDVEASGRGRFAFIVGNGTSEDIRSDAFAVEWDGNVLMDIDTSASTGKDADLYAAISKMFWFDCIVDIIS